ncbi:MAG: DUF4325 domain-containing protein [Patescibacteria group bacterium]
MQEDVKKILSIAKIKRRVSAQDVAVELKMSRQAAHKKIAQLVREGSLRKVGRTRGVSYVLPSQQTQQLDGIVRKLTNKQLQEHKVLEDVFLRLALLRSLPENVQSIFRYAFSEMLNNAIEHSKSPRIEIRVSVADGLLTFSVRDFGIGVFRCVMEKFNLASQMDAIGELLKGKTTTAPKAHSGEGIFFTSKIADTFRLESFGYELLVENTIPDIFVRTVQSSKKGTFVQFIIGTTSKKHLIDLFREYESTDGEHDFEKTKIFVKLYTYGTVHVSRSQARRILEHLPERFSHVVLDFDQVPTIGQAFADEIFRVFHHDHPDIVIEAIQANEAVQFMIDRVRSR